MKLMGIEKVVKVCGLSGIDGVILLRKQWDDNPANEYLEKVLVVRDPEAHAHPYVVWGHNLEAGGYFGGDYHKDLAAAAEAFKNR